MPLFDLLCVFHEATSQCVFHIGQVLVHEIFHFSCGIPVGLLDLSN